MDPYKKFHFMASTGVDWLNGVISRLFGGAASLIAEHPWLIYLILLIPAAIVSGALAIWGVRRVRRFVHHWRVALALVPSGAGRRCLRLAREIRGRCGWLRHTIRREVADRAERQSLTRHLERFTAVELPSVLETARVFISQADDRGEAALRAALEAQTRRWSENPDSGAREQELEAIAKTRQSLAKVSQANRERDRLLGGLEEAAGALRELEAEFAGLRIARERVLPDLKEHLEDLTRQLSYLKSAHRELNESDPRR
ncbi:MAG: hypothetical protein V3S64_00240 [bacterium]